MSSQERSECMENLIAKHWHHLPAEEVVDLLDGNPEKGLDHFEVKHRLETDLTPR